MSHIIRFNKTRKVKSPSSAYEYAAATDFYCPEYDAKFYSDLISKNSHTEYYECDISVNRDSMSITIAPNGRINIPSGIRVIIDDPHMCLLAVNKSGIAANKGLILGACLVDADYRGEVHLNLINTSSEPVKIKTGDKLVQFMYLPIAHCSYAEISDDEFNSEPQTARGSGGFGSSDLI